MGQACFERSTQTTKQNLRHRNPEIHYLNFHLFCKSLLVPGDLILPHRFRPDKTVSLSQNLKSTHPILRDLIQQMCLIFDLVCLSLSCVSRDRGFLFSLCVMVLWVRLCRREVPNSLVGLCHVLGFRWLVPTFYAIWSHSGVDIALDSESKGRGFDSHWDHLFCFCFFWLLVYYYSQFILLSNDQLNLGLPLVGFMELYVVDLQCG